MIAIPYLMTFFILFLLENSIFYKHKKGKINEFLEILDKINKTNNRDKKYFQIK